VLLQHHEMQSKKIGLILEMHYMHVVMKTFNLIYWQRLCRNRLENTWLRKKLDSVHIFWHIGPACSCCCILCLCML